MGFLLASLTAFAARVPAFFAAVAAREPAFFRLRPAFDAAALTFFPAVADFLATTFLPFAATFLTFRPLSAIDPRRWVVVGNSGRDPVVDAVCGSQASR